MLMYFILGVALIYFVTVIINYLSLKNRGPNRLMVVYAFPGSRFCFVKLSYGLSGRDNPYFVGHIPTKMNHIPD